MKFREARRALRWFDLWRGLGWSMIAAVLYLSLMPNPPSLDVSAGDKWSHAAGYAGLMLWFAQLYARPLHWRLAAGLIGLGVSIEFAQGMTDYRSFEYLDMLADASGVFIGWWLGGTRFGAILQRAERLVLAR
ncbi:MAG: VanZ family protein [Pseudomonadota bacterium]